jgi:hypothetical protein
MKINLSGLTLLTILFVGLKLTDHIDWSWWWVLSPTIFQVGMLVFFLGLGLLFGFLRVMSRK